mgnify:CR=1 FL=1
MCNKGGRVRRYGWGKNKKKTDLKITKFYTEEIPKTSRHHPEGREVWKSREKMEIIIAKFVYLKQTRIFANVIRKIFDSMTSLAVNKLWSFLQSLSLSANNERWLAERLLESANEKTARDNATETKSVWASYPLSQEIKDMTLRNRKKVSDTHFII